MKMVPNAKKRKRPVATPRQDDDRIREKKKTKKKKKAKKKKSIDSDDVSIGNDNSIVTKSSSMSLISSLLGGDDSTAYSSNDTKKSTSGMTAPSSLMNSIFNNAVNQSSTASATSSTMSLFNNPKIPAATRRYQTQPEKPPEKKAESKRADAKDEDSAETIRRTMQNRKLRSQDRPLLKKELDFPGVFNNEEEDEENGVFLLDDENERAKETADAIRDHGFCVVRNVMECGNSAESNDRHPLRDVVLPKVKELQQKLNKALKSRGIHHSTETFRFREAASRCRGRTDVVFDAFERDPKMVDAKQKILRNPKIFPVIRSLLGGANNSGDSGNDDDASGDVKLVYAGLIFSYPGSCDQPWHQDGEPLFPDLPREQSAALQASLPPYALNVFLPLEDADGSIEKGPTEFLPGSHKWTDPDERLRSILEEADGKDNDDGSEASSDDETVFGDKAIIAPVLKQGDALIYDYRVCHRGTSNLFGRVEDGKKGKIKKKDKGSENDVGGSRRILYLMYARPWFTDHVNFDYTKSAESLWDGQQSGNSKK